MSDLMEGQNPGSFGGTITELSPSAVGPGQPSSLFQFRGDPNDPQMITVALNAIANNPNIGAPGGYVVGTASFGSGTSGAQKFEFDVPLRNANDGFGSGTLLSVPAANLEISVRNDGGVVPPGGTSVPLSSGGIVTVSAAAATKPRPGNTPLTRTIYGVLASVVGNGVAPGVTLSISVPAFAKSFRVLRSSIATTAININVSSYLGGGIIDGPYVIAAGAAAPSISLPSGATTVSIQNDAASATNLRVCGVEFTLAL